MSARFTHRLARPRAPASSRSAWPCGAPARHRERSVGLSRDEGFYVEAADRYGACLELLVGIRPRPLPGGGQRPAPLGHNNEHPPLAKTMFRALPPRGRALGALRAAVHRVPLLRHAL
ncbi:MAG: hypothetical protein M5U28_05550 [Sandaracinaceae bacterium]|nr:hypothetical protein [Sandaracinaceae bacterium]